MQATCGAAKEIGLNRVGLFGTRFTMQAGFYQESCGRAGITVITPNLEEQIYVHERYVQELVNGIILPETLRSLLDIVGTMKQRDQIEGLILGGTELPLILKDGGHGIPFLNTTRIHVNAALDRLLEGQ